MRIADVPQRKFLTDSYRVRRHPHHRLAPAGSPAKRSPKFQMPSNRPRSDYSTRPLVQPGVATTIAADLMSGYRGKTKGSAMRSSGLVGLRCWVAVLPFFISKFSD